MNFSKMKNQSSKAVEFLDDVFSEELGVEGGCDLSCTGSCGKSCDVTCDNTCMSTKPFEQRIK